MALYNFGSVSATSSYTVERVPEAGETLSASRCVSNLGGSGANQSVAVCFAGAQAIHIGTLGHTGQWLLDMLGSTGVDIRHIELDPAASDGHQIILQTQDGHLRKVRFEGSNGANDPERVTQILSEAGPDDILLLQNETNAQAEVAALAQGLGMYVVYTATPFDAEAIARVMPFVSLLALSARDLPKLSKALGTTINALNVPEVLVLDLDHKTIVWQNLPTGRLVPIDLPDLQVNYRSSALDVAVGFFVARRALNDPVETGLTLAGAAAGLYAARTGLTDPIPDLLEVKTFLHSPA